MFYYPPECDFCQARCASGALRKDLPPAQIHASWYDIFLVDSFFDFSTLVAKGKCGGAALHCIALHCIALMDVCRYVHTFLGSRRSSAC